MLHAIRWALIIAGIPLVCYLFREILHPSPKIHRTTRYEFD